MVFLRGTSRFLAAYAALALTGSVMARQPSTSAQHVERAFALAGESHLKMTAQLQCGTGNAAMKYLQDPSIIPPTKVFDNVVYLGFSGVGAYALLSDQGIILIDSLNSTNDVKTVIEPGLKALGLAPASIKFIIITQGHGDHYGGAKYIAEKYGARLMMSAADWKLVEKIGNETPFANDPRFSPPPARDQTLTDRQIVKLGNTKVEIVLTPGHSPATASLIFPAYANGKRHTVGMWGGTGIPRAQSAIRDYANSARRFLGISRSRRVDVELNTHPFVADSLRRMEQLRDHPENGNPFVIGPVQYANYTRILEECARSKLTENQQ